MTFKAQGHWQFAVSITIGDSLQHRECFSPPVPFFCAKFKIVGLL